MTVEQVTSMNFATHLEAYLASNLAAMKNQTICATAEGVFIVVADTEGSPIGWQAEMDAAKARALARAATG